MSFSLIYWILMLLWLIYGLWGWYQPNPNWVWGHQAFLFILFLLLGWAEFGPPVRP